MAPSSAGSEAPSTSLSASVRGTSTLSPRIRQRCTSRWVATCPNGSGSARRRYAECLTRRGQKRASEHSARPAPPLARLAARLAARLLASALINGGGGCWPSRPPPRTPYTLTCRPTRFDQAPRWCSTSCAGVYMCTYIRTHILTHAYVRTHAYVHAYMQGARGAACAWRPLQRKAAVQRACGDARQDTHLPAVGCGPLTNMHVYVHTNMHMHMHMHIHIHIRLPAVGQ